MSTWRRTWIPPPPIGLIAYTGIGLYLEDVVNRPVDMVVRPCRKPHLRAEVERDCVNAF